MALKDQGQIPHIYSPTKDLHIIHLMVRFGDPDFNCSTVIARTIHILTVLTQIDLEGHDQITPYTILTKNFPKYTFKPNLMILVLFFQSYHADQNVHVRTDRGTTQVTIP